YQNFRMQQLNDEIEENNRNLNEINAAKDKFFAIIAHDLKNPFNSIKGFTDLLVENNQNYPADKRLKFLKIIESSTNRVTGLLNNLLIWAKSQSGKIPFTPVNIDLNDEITDIISLFEAQALSKDVSFNLTLISNQKVFADKNMLQTIIRNLVSNAVKFTNQYGTIKISTEDENDFVKIKISDNGVGMAEEKLNELFAVNANNSSLGTANEKGSGLGLVLVKEFIDKNGGKISVKSQINKGTEFCLKLPAVCSEPLKRKKKLKELVKL
ncbi:MAG: sensor histidine kinase, partial [Lutibacter sp.]